MRVDLARKQERKGGFLCGSEFAVLRFWRVFPFSSMATPFPIPVTAAQVLLLLLLLVLLWFISIHIENSNHVLFLFVQVGTYFVGQYYQVLQSQPEFVHQFYSDASTMLRIDGNARETAAAMLVISALFVVLLIPNFCFLLLLLLWFENC